MNEPRRQKAIRLRLGKKVRGVYLMYHIDEGLGVVPTEVADHLHLILTCEDCLNQRDEFVGGKGRTN